MAILKYLTTKGFPLKRAGSIYRMRCPFHHDIEPSFVVYPENSHWFCYGACYDGGTLWDLVRRLEFPHLSPKEGFKQAARILEEGKFVPAAPPLPPVARPNLTLTTEQRESMRWLMRQYQQELQQNKEAKDYLMKRGIDDVLTRWLRLGWCSGREPEITVAHAIAHLGSAEPLFDVGFLGRPDSTDIYERASIYERMRGRIVLAEYRQIDGEEYPIWAQGRRLDNSDPRYMSLPLPKVYFGIDRARAAHTVVLVEGFFDYAPLVGAGVSAIALANCRLKAEAVPFFKGKKVILCLDNDEAGQRGTEDAVALLKNTARVEVKYPPPDVKDINSWAAKWGLSDVLQTLEVT